MGRLQIARMLRVAAVGLLLLLGCSAGVQECGAWSWVVAEGPELGESWCLKAGSVRVGGAVYLAPCWVGGGVERWRYDGGAGSLSVERDGTLCVEAVWGNAGCCGLVLGNCSEIESQRWVYNGRMFEHGPSWMTGGKTMFLKVLQRSDDAANLTVAEVASGMSFTLLAARGEGGGEGYTLQDRSLRSRGEEEEGKGHGGFNLNMFLIVGLAVAASLGWALALVFGVLLWLIWHKYRAQKTSELTRLIEKSGPFSCRSAESDAPSRLRMFGYEELEHATSQFTTLVGKDEFWESYIARFPDKTWAVVKREISGGGCDGDFNIETSSVAKVQHPCLVDLLGFCQERGEHIVVLEHMPEGSLFDRLHSSKGAAAAALNWAHRMRIAYDVACGMQYLHQFMIPPIMHGSIKSSNIFLGEPCSAKLGDWCLLKLRRPDAVAGNFSKFSNTLGFPEVQSPRASALKEDIHGFGVVLLELLLGVPEQELMSSWAHKISASQDPLSLVDPLLGKEVDVTELEVVLEVARRCTNSVKRLRPSMFEVERTFKDKLWRSINATRV